MFLLYSSDFILIKVTLSGTSSRHIKFDIALYSIYGRKLNFVILLIGIHSFEWSNVIRIGTYHRSLITAIFSFRQ